MDIAKGEYDFLLGFYLHLSVFDPFTVTFKHLTSTERQEVNVDDLGVAEEAPGDNAQGAG